MRPAPVQRPQKRTRVNADGPESTSSHPPSPQVKYERSPSPERRLVTSGTKRYAPIPNDCLSSCPEYRRNRSEWVARCVKELEALNLIPERKLIRDDGLIIDWNSHVPVWSDTLKPDPLDLAATIMLAHRSNARWRLPPIPTESLPKSVATTSSDTQPPLKKTLPVPPRPSLKRRNDNNSSQSVSINSRPGGRGPSSPCSERPRLPNEIEREIASSAHSPSCNRMSSLADHIPIPSDISNQHGQVTLPLKPPNRTRDPSIAPCTSSAAEEEISEMTLNYLRRYVQTYEADRASLAFAYARNASLAYRVHQIVQNTSDGALSIWTASPQCCSSGTKRTRLDIVTTLLTLPCLHSNVQSPGTAQVEYDMFHLGAQLGMFVRKEVDAEDAAVEGVWPLTATVHQILVFQT